MGRAIADTVERHGDLVLAGVWARGGDLDTIIATSDVVVDFSLPDGTMEVLDGVVRHAKPLVCGVSGLSEAQYEKLVATSGRVALLYDRNMSLGIAVLERAVQDALARLGPDFDVEVSETHHVHKKDAPSGTALRLAEAIAAVRGESGTGSVAFNVERRGEVPGDHEVIMTSPSERLRFAHSVATRQVFADGALRAARWIVARSPGLYRMTDVLFED